ncbi:ComF family protein [Neorhodopirellula pilleata]|uniref:DNA utilization protein GntX n=1 Tax=Neorhodopirellula pilleata TaxID=2714738 RepID=A0A5C5ZX98_9BACT|nr:ComF family protein [Neorhodopirellula pilleata]TWT92254.1 DNA utilization protein GntX [Neorhodopirellula pilleata]
MLFQKPARTIAETISDAWNSLAPLVFPPACCLCSEPTPMRITGENESALITVFCRACETSLVQTGPLLENACMNCGWPRGLCRGFASGGELLPCPRCAARKNSHPFSRITPLYRYQDTVTAAVVAAKYPRNSAITRELARRLAVRCKTRWPELTVLPRSSTPIVTSVPSPVMRQARRGGSGTRLLGQHFAAETGLPYRALMRTTRSIAKQAWLDDDSRRENVSGAFALRRIGFRRPVLMGREIILVDDVMTTGATADEITRVLLDAGAVRVSVAVVALAMREDL